MEKLHVPYNFVPLANKVYYPEWAHLISHDIPFSDGEDGIIELSIQNHTPLFTRNSVRRDDKDEYSSYVLDSSGQKKYFIPGSTLRGCFRSVMEILSFAKMNIYNDDSFGFRYFTTQRKGMPSFVEQMKGIKCGWMQKKGEDYVIYECLRGVQKIRHYTILKMFFPDFLAGEDGETAATKQVSMDPEEIYPIVDVEEGAVTYKENKQEKRVPAGRYRIVCTGYMEGKKVEYLFSEEQSEAVNVDKEVIKAFNSVHKHTPHYAGLNGKGGYLKERLENGEQIPVFYKKQGQKIESIGITRMYKYPFKYSVREAVLNNYDMEERKKMANGIDMPQAVFGHVGDNPLKGRVVIGNAFMDGVVNDDQLIEFKTVLGQPRASYYPLYVKQNANASTINNYSTENAKVAGRKRYRVIDNGKLVEPIKGNGNDKVLSTLRLLPKNNIFKCRIVVHNMRMAEIGALLSAITYNLTPDTYHSIGQGKSFGFGKVKCSVTSMTGLEYSVEEYIGEFNKHISYFLQTECHSTLGSNESIRMLVSIASPTHSAEDIKQMELDEFDKFKDEDKFYSITEKQQKLNVMINEQTVIKEMTPKYIEQGLRGARLLMRHRDWESARIRLITLISFCKNIDVDSSDVENLLADCRKKAEDEQIYKNKVDSQTASLQTLVNDIDNYIKVAVNFIKSQERSNALQNIDTAKQYIEQAKEQALELKEFVNGRNDYTKVLEDVSSFEKQLSDFDDKICDIITQLPPQKADTSNLPLDEFLKQEKYPASKFDKWLKRRGEKLTDEERTVLGKYIKEGGPKVEKDFKTKSKLFKKLGVIQ